MTDIAQRGNRLTRTGYAKGGRTGHLAGGVIKKVIQGGKKILKGKGKKGLGSGIKPSEMHEIIPKGDRKLYLKEKLANPHKRIGKAGGGWMLRKPVQKLLEGIGGGSEGKPHSTRAGRISAGARRIKRGVKKAKK